MKKKILLCIYFVPVLLNSERVANFNCCLFQNGILLSSID